MPCTYSCDKVAVSYQVIAASCIQILTNVLKNWTAVLTTVIMWLEITPAPAIWATIWQVIVTHVMVSEQNKVQN